MFAFLKKSRKTSNISFKFWQRERKVGKQNLPLYHYGVLRPIYNKLRISWTLTTNWLTCRHSYTLPTGATKLISLTNYHLLLNVFKLKDVRSWTFFHSVFIKVDIIYPTSIYWKDYQIPLPFAVGRCSLTLPWCV